MATRQRRQTWESERKDRERRHGLGDGDGVRRSHTVNCSPRSVMSINRTILSRGQLASQEGTLFNLSMKRLLLLVGVLAGVSACGGGGDGAESIPIDDLSAQLLAKVCGHLVACGSYPDLATCDDALFFNDQVEADVHAGKVVYDGRAAAKCLAFYDDLSCKASEIRNVPSATTGPCAATVKGTLATGAACIDSDVCVSGFCLKSSCGTDACCMGTCAERPAAGGDCTTDSNSCAAGLVCQWNSDQRTGTCAAPVMRGAPCTATTICETGSFCVTDPVTQTKSCGSLPGTGAPCPDQRCDDQEDACDGVEKICVRRIPAGGACVAGHNICVSYAPCDGATGTCLLRGRAGAPCTAPEDCILGLSCDAGACVAHRDEPACQ